MSTAERPKSHPGHPGFDVEIVEPAQGDILGAEYDIPEWLQGDPADEADAPTQSNDAEPVSDGQTVEADTVEQQNDNEADKPKGRFSKMFAKAKNAYPSSITDGRWDAQPIQPNVQAFDATDTWQDPYEKFFGKAQPVVQYTAVPPLKQKAKKAEAATSDEVTNDTPESEKQTRRKAVAAKVAGAWAAEIDRHVYDAIDLQKHLIGSLKTYKPTDADKVQIAKDVEQAEKQFEEEQKRLDAQEKADRRAARKQTARTQLGNAKELAQKLPAKEAKKLAARGAVGAVALGGAVASKTYNRLKDARAKRMQTATTSHAVASPIPTTTPESAASKPKDTSAQDALDELRKIVPDA